MQTAITVLVAIILALAVALILSHHGHLKYFRSNLHRGQLIRYGKDLRKARVIRKCTDTRIVVVDCEDLKIITVEITQIFPE